MFLKHTTHNTTESKRGVLTPMEENRVSGDIKTLPTQNNTDGSSEFEAVSCFVISKDSKARRWMIQLIKWPYPFENSAIA